MCGLVPMPTAHSSSSMDGGCQRVYGPALFDNSSRHRTNKSEQRVHRCRRAGYDGPVAGNSFERGQSVSSRLLRIVDAFDQDAPELGLVEIGRRTGLPAATLHRLLGELVRHGTIERTGAGRYTIGMRLWEIGTLAPRISRVDEISMPYL